MRKGAHSGARGAQWLLRGVWALPGNAVCAAWDAGEEVGS